MRQKSNVFFSVFQGFYSMMSMQHLNLQWKAFVKAWQYKPWGLISSKILVLSCYSHTAKRLLHMFVVFFLSSSFWTAMAGNSKGKILYIKATFPCRHENACKWSHLSCISISSAQLCCTTKLTIVTPWREKYASQSMSTLHHPFSGQVLTASTTKCTFKAEQGCFISDSSRGIGVYT